VDAPGIAEMDDLRFQFLDPNTLEIDPVNERTSNVNPHSDDGESLQESIKEQGVIEPIVVREIDDQYYVIAGQRRTLAAQAAGVDTIPARIMEMSDREARIVSITENAEQFKKDVPAEDRAAAVNALREEGMSFSEIASRMGMSEPTIRTWVEPALSYWEDTVFDPEKESGSNPGLSDISPKALQIIRKNTDNKQNREKIAKRVVDQNVSNRLLKEASKRSDTAKEFRKELNRIINEINSEITIVRGEVRFTGEAAEMLEDIMKSRGVNEKKAIESLVEKRLGQIKYERRGEWIGLRLSEDTMQKLRDIASDSASVQPETLVRKIVDRWLDDSEYCQE
jgi:ParB family chromosome partitioning protein